MIERDNGSFLHRFVEFCREGACFPDYMSIQSFHGALSEVIPGNWAEAFKLQEREPFPVSDDPDNLRHRFDLLNELLRKSEAPSIPLLLEDWGSSQWQHDPRNDTCFKAAFFVKNALQNRDRYAMASSLKLTDLMEERPVKQRVFHGGHGLLTVDGIPKSGYHACRLLGRLGTRVVAEGEGYCVARDGDAVQILFYHYCHSTSLSNHHLRLDDDPYSAFVSQPPREFELTLEHMRPGRYNEEFYSVSPKQGSAYDAWITMGAPEKLTAFQQQYLRGRSAPDYRVCVEEIVDSFRFTTTLHPHEVQLVLLVPQE